MGTIKGRCPNLLWELGILLCYLLDPMMLFTPHHCIFWYLHSLITFACYWSFFVQLNFLLIQLTIELTNMVSDLVYPNPLSILIATFAN